MGRGFESLQAYQFLICFLRLRGYLNQPTLGWGASEVHFRSYNCARGFRLRERGQRSATLSQKAALWLLQHPVLPARGLPQVILRCLGLESTVRASPAPYITCEDIGALIAALLRIQARQGYRGL